MGPKRKSEIDLCSKVTPTYMPLPRLRALPFEAFYNECAALFSEKQPSLNANRSAAVAPGYHIGSLQILRVAQVLCN